MPPGTRNALASSVQNTFAAPVTPMVGYYGMPVVSQDPAADAAFFRGMAGSALRNTLLGIAYPAEVLRDTGRSLRTGKPVGQISVYADLLEAARKFNPSAVPGAVANYLQETGRRFRSSPEEAGAVLGENLDVRNWLKPRGVLKKDIFVGPKSKTWNSNRHAAAVQMERNGKSPEEIWSATGTWRAPDGHWRQEISDKNMQFRDDFGKRGLTEENKYQYPPAKPLPETLSAPELTAAYPETRSLSVNARKLPDWVPESSSSGGALTTMTDKPVGIFAYNKTAEGALDTTAHELQHVVQQIEGFAPGGLPTQFYREVEQALQQQNPDRWAALTKEQRRDMVEQQAFQKYRSLMGEAEARATAARRNLSWLERRQRFPGLDYDIPFDQLIR